MKSPIVAALIFFCALSSLSIAARADAVSDQLKAYKALGIKVDTHTAPLCYLITKSEAAKYLGKPVQNGESAGAASGCAYRAADRSNDGILITRAGRNDWYAPTDSKYYKKIDGIGEKAYVNYEQGLGFEANALTKSGVTGIQLSGKGTAATAIALLRLAITR